MPSVSPLCFYADGVVYERTDSVIGFWIQFLHSPRRHLWAVIRHTEVCGCGCRGWCSYYPIWSALAWSLECLKLGKHPSVRHDGSRFLPGERIRADAAESEMPFKAVCCFVKGDWSDSVKTLGCTGWGANERPCPLCASPRGDLYDVTDFSASGMPHAAVDGASYETTCRKWDLQTIFATQDDLDTVVGHMHFEGRVKDGTSRS